MVVDRLSKQIHAIPTVTSLDSTRVTQLFLEHIWHHHGLLEEVISNCRSAFISNFSHKLTALLGVKLTPSTSYHPQTDGQTERMNQERGIPLGLHEPSTRQLGQLAPTSGVCIQQQSSHSNPSDSI